MSSERARASHILIKHQGSRRPASWKDEDGKFIRSTTRESAVALLESLSQLIVTDQASFDAIAARCSDCNSARRGGDLDAQFISQTMLLNFSQVTDVYAGPFGRGQMQKPFEEVTFALKVGEMSDIVDTESGVHIIMRTA